jgi:type I restriction enzyme S subunit
MLSWLTKNTLDREVSMKIKDIGNVVTGKTPQTAHAEFYGGDYMFITPTELHGGYKISSSEKTLTEAGLESIKTNSIDGISVLVGCIGWDMGNVAMCFEKCATNQQINSITQISEDYSPYFLYYWLSTKKEYLFSISSVTRTPILSKGVFEEIEIPSISRSEQDKIAKVLLVLDKKIKLNSEVNDNLAQQLRLLYDYWFTQFDFPDESGNPYRSSGGQMVWSNDAKKELPASWNSAKMSDAIEGIRTGLNPRDNFKLGNGTIKYITVKNLRSDGILDFSGCDTIDETARAIVHRRSDVCTGDILFASIAPLGRCHLVQELPQDWDINESVFSIRCNKATVTPEYLYMHLQSEAFVKESTACSTGSVFKGIRINTLLDSRVFLPPMQVIEKFSQQTKPLFSLQYKLNKEIQALTQLRDWLLPMLMNGQATVSD